MADRIDYAQLERSAHVVEVAARFERMQSKLVLDAPEWRRLAYCAELAVAGRVIDAGSGPGVLPHLLLARRQDVGVISADLKRHSAWVARDGVEYVDWDIRKPHPSFLRPAETVFCLQTLQMLTARETGPVLEQLRKLTNARLIVSIPFSEREPLWWHDKPGGHRQRFTLDKLAEFFPNAVGTILPRPSTDVVIVVEDSARPADYFHLIDRDRLLERLSLGDPSDDKPR
jgi:uncharacterized UPF0146 family protein